MENGPFNSPWHYLIYGAIVPVVLFMAVSTVMERSARRRGRSRPGTRGLALPLLGTSLALFVVGQSAAKMLQLSAFSLFLFGAAFLFFPSNRATQRLPLDGALGEAGTIEGQPRSDFWILLLLAFGLLLMVVSSLFVTAAILSLLAMPILLVGVAMTYSQLFRLSAMPTPPRFRASRGLGGLLLFLGVFAMATVQCALTVTHGGRNKPPIDASPGVLLIQGVSWVAIMGVVALGLWLRRCELMVLVAVVLLVLGTFVLTITLGSMVWPTVPLSL